MAARVNRRQTPKYAPTERYIDECREFAGSLGFRMQDVFERFCLLVLLRQQFQMMPLEVIEWLALRDVKAMHDRRGQAPS